VLIFLIYWSIFQQQVLGDEMVWFDIPTWTWRFHSVSDGGAAGCPWGWRVAGCAGGWWGACGAATVAWRTVRCKYSHMIWWACCSFYIVWSDNQLFLIYTICYSLSMLLINSAREYATFYGFNLYYILCVLFSIVIVILLTFYYFLTYFEIV
jgi:hypothetical protein